MLLPCLFNLRAEYIMWKARLDEVQAGIENGGRNINNPRYADDTILIAESEEELKSLLRKVTEESEKAGLRPTFRLIHVNVWQKPPQCCKVISLQLK